MKLRAFILVVAILAGGAVQAARNPSPPPSGIVVHLFGPGSVTSRMLPEPAPSAPPTMANGIAPAGTPASAPGQMPAMGNILHQMFVVGDPDAKPGQALAKGRGGERN